ncbi:transporter [Solirubrobacter taibaiensis]|nr:transporter [Solirubrobacter taibaiensis]
MIWLTWRQFRFPAAVVFGAAVLLALMLFAAGVPAAGDQALEFLSNKRGDVQIYTFVTIAMMLAPAVIGMFWGAPLVARELEAGTHRLVWNQSVTRTRWLLIKVGLIAVTAMVVAGALGLLLTWWAGPIDDAQIAGQEAQGIVGSSRVGPPLFISRGIAPIGYFVFAFAVGVLAGTLIRRTVAAMAVTAVVFTLVQLAVPPLVRAHLDPVVKTITVTPENLGGFMMSGPGGEVVELGVRLAAPGAWMISNETVDGDGNVTSTFPTWLPDCVRPDVEKMRPIADPACFKRFADLGYRQRVTYQPADRYWTLQAVETIGFLALSGGLFGLTLFWVRRRV